MKIKDRVIYRNPKIAHHQQTGVITGSPIPFKGEPEWPVLLNKDHGEKESVYLPESTLEAA